jgi:hypothetical protein
MHRPLAGRRWSRRLPTVDIWELVAREQIRDTIARYNHCGDRGRFDEMVEQFLPDGVLELADFDERHAGRAAMRTFFAGVAASFGAPTRPDAHLRHFVTNTTIVVTDPATATADSYFLVVTESGPDHWGRYRDRFAPHDGRWLLAHRTVRTDGWAPHSAFRRG